MSLPQRLAAAGFGDVVAVETVSGGMVAAAGVATRADGTRVFAKTVTGAGPDLFAVEAEGLDTLRAAGVATPRVLHVVPDLLVLEHVGPRVDTPAAWEAVAHLLARLHTTTGDGRFGWHRNGWLGRLPQYNGWDTDGHRFFAERRILRWLPEPLVERTFDAGDRWAIERLCTRLPDLVPPMPAVLTHGDLWSGNILAGPSLIDPAVSWTWAEADLSMLWCGRRPPESARCFDVYDELTGHDPAWRDRAPVLHLLELLSTIAHGDDDWGAADAVRAVIAPFRPRRPFA